MKLVFDPSYSREQLTAEFWEEVILDAQAEAMLRKIDEGRIHPPWLWSD